MWELPEGKSRWWLQKRPEGHISEDWGAGRGGGGHKTEGSVLRRHRTNPWPGPLSFTRLSFPFGRSGNAFKGTNVTSVPCRFQAIWGLPVAPVVAFPYEMQI